MTPHDFTRLLDAHAGALTLYARQRCDCPEDVVQDAFLKLVGLRKPPREPAAWLYRVVRNGAIDASRRSQRRKRREAVVARPARWFVEDELDGLTATLAVKALENLPLDEREAIVARLWGGLGFEQIAELANCSVSTAFRRFTAGIEALRKELGIVDREQGSGIRGQLHERT
jgi:RNA polymerase sigma factor (sigma-70 family)